MCCCNAGEQTVIATKRAKGKKEPEKQSPMAIRDARRRPLFVKSSAKVAR
jgi:hypothetical protein